MSTVIYHYDICCRKEFGRIITFSSSITYYQLRVVSSHANIQDTFSDVTGVGGYGAPPHDKVFQSSTTLQHCRLHKGQK